MSLSTTSSRVGAVLILGAFAPAQEPADPRPVHERFADPTTAPSPSFRRHVVPFAARNGCSSRECHGAFAGQGEFQLSLFGYDFDADHAEITNDKKARIRVAQDDPDRSLILLKPTLQKDHDGDLRFERDGWEYNLLRRWIADGAKNDAKQTGALDRLDVTPREIVFGFGDAPAPVPLRVVAHWQDGTVEDVTDLTRFRTNDESVAAVTDDGLVERKGHGDTHVVAFYDNDVVPIPVLVPVSDAIGPRYQKVATPTTIDALVVDKLRKLGIVPSGTCSDDEFLRRASLDVTGTLPTPQEVEAFLADRSPDKRANKIDELLLRPGHAAWWATKLCDLTGNNPAQLQERTFRQEQSRQWYEWLEARIAKNVPYDEIVAGIVLATGRTSPEQSYRDYAAEMSSYYRKDAPASFADRPDLPHYWARRNLRMPEEKALGFSHAFLGVRLQCAQCHKHPFDQWTKTDFEQFQAFFEPVRYGPKPGARGEYDYRQALAELRSDAGIEGRGNVDAQARRRLEAEVQKRVRNGESVPWQEVFVEEPGARRPLRRPRPNQNQRAFAGRVITPKVLGGDEVLLTRYADPREPVMEWLRSPDNPYFARAFVNRVWASYFHRGIVEPPDDLNLANPPSNEPLLDWLSREFIARGYDIRWLHREILQSDTYQRSWQPNETNRLDERNFSRMVVRRLPAEVALDAIAQATASRDDAARRVHDMAGRSIGPGSGPARGDRSPAGYALSVFGKPSRVTTCDCERSNEPSLLQTVFTLNDPAVLTALDGQGQGRRGGGFVDEVRRELGGAAPQNEQRARLRTLLERRPKAPTGDDARELARYRRALARWQEQVRAARGQAEPERKAEVPAAKLEALVRETFLRALSRPPSRDELKQAKADVAAAKDPADGLRDLLWALLNTKEFLVNH